MDLNKIYESFYKHSRYDIGYILLKKVKKECNCTTDDILKAQSLHKVQEIKIGNRIVYSHTPIEDFGISKSDITKSKKKDIK